MKVRFSELNGRYECDHRRKFGYNLKDAETQVTQLALLQKSVLISALNGKLQISDIPQAISEGMEGISFKSKKGKELMCKDITNRILRAASDFQYHQKKSSVKWDVMTDLPEHSITVGIGKEPVIIEKVRPDIVVTYKVGNITYVDAYNIRIGAPTKKDGSVYKPDDAAADKQLYVLLKYAESVAQSLPDDGNGIYTIRSGFLFLRKKTDKYPTQANPSGHFDEWLFTDDEGKDSSNVVTIEETVHRDTLEKGTCNGILDNSFMDVFNTFIDGIPMESCTKEQCANCELDEICHYTHAPVQISHETKAPSLNAIQLSPIQEQIELFNAGYAVVNAVPGAGKTLVLVLRIVNLLLNGVKPEEIAIITFTNSGAEVFRERIALYNEELGNGDPVDGMTATTFNGLGQKILEKEYAMLGFAKPPRVIDPIERSGIIADLLNRHEIPGLDYRNFTTDMKNCRGALAMASICFQVMKQNRWTRFDVDAIAEKVGTRFCDRKAIEALAELYDEYCDTLLEKSLVEYADQEVIILDMLQRNPYYFDNFGWKHILVDESQDTSENQFELLKYMTKTTSFESLMVVGDDSQSIYGFRDTSPKFFINFEQVMGLPKGTVKAFYMTDNFRSTPEIIDFANKIVSRNREKIEKEIVPRRPSGPEVCVKGYCDQNEEYVWIVKEIAEKVSNGTAPEDIAFIASTRTELLKMADLLTMEDIPSVMLNPERMQENSRVTAALSLSRYFQDSTATKDILIYLNAMLGGDIFMLTDKMIEEAIKLKHDEVLQIKAMPEKEFKEAYFKLLDVINEDDEVYESFVNTLSNQPSMAAVLNYCNDFSLYGERAEKRRDHSYPGVVLTTAHSSKGKEWPIVFNSLSKYDSEDVSVTKDSIEERRRLLFVSATRARDELYVTSKYVAYGNKKNRHLNMFLQESYEAAGIEYDSEKITDEIKAKDDERARKRKEERERLKEEFIKKINNAVSDPAKKK